jgi:hypothetical protein
MTRPDGPTDWHREVYARMRAEGVKYPGGDDLPDAELLATDEAEENRPEVLSLGENFAEDLRRRYPGLPPEVIGGFLVRVAGMLRGLAALGLLDDRFAEFNGPTVFAVLSAAGVRIDQETR